MKMIHFILIMLVVGVCLIGFTSPQFPELTQMGFFGDLWTSLQDIFSPEISVSSTVASIISPYESRPTGRYKVLSQTGNESFYDVKFVPVEVDKETHYAICLEADFDSRIIEVDGKNITYTVPNTFSYYKGTELVKQNDLVNVKVLNINKFCTLPLNPLEEKYLKFGDNSVIIVGEEDVYIDGLLTNVTVEPGNFSHLTIDDANLVAYWSFDGDKENTVTTTAFDLSENDNDGTLVGTAVINSTSGLYDNGAWFDGNSDYIGVPYSQSLNFSTGSFTISTWIYSNEGAIAVNDYLVSQYDAGGNRRAIALLKETNALIKVYIDDDGTSGLECSESGSTITPANTWYHIAGVFDDVANTISIYVNGSLDSAPASCTTNPFDTNEPWTIGSRDGGSYLNGSMDEVMIFNYALNSSQITDIYNNQSARFKSTGTQEINNQSLLNISSGNNRVNVSSTIENNLDSIYLLLRLECKKNLHCFLHRKYNLK